MSDTVLRTEGLKKYFYTDHRLFSRDRSYVPAVDDVSIEIKEGETLGLVGESGSGKTTLAKLVLGLLTPTAGKIEIDGTAGAVFQDPASSLDPRMKIRDIIAEPLKTWKIYDTPQKTEERILELLDMVELNEESLDRYPHQFSGGQKQRIGIARAIALKPALLICDESVSALDVCVQAQILNLLKKLKKQLGLTCLFISHDLSVVSFIADRVCVMKDGSICELAPADRLYAAPEHEYTKYLLASIPRPECHSPSYNPAKP